VSYSSPSLGEVSFGWTGPLRVGGREVQLDGEPRFDNPYCQADLGTRCYAISSGGDTLVLDFGLPQ
jgi:hypothetical protein